MSRGSRSASSFGLAFPLAFLPLATTLRCVSLTLALLFVRLLLGVGGGGGGVVVVVVVVVVLRSHHWHWLCALLDIRHALLNGMCHASPHG